jgi:selenocysteine lyase/cysteine desulfurase
VNEGRFPGVVAARAEGRVLADNAASTQIPREALDAVTHYLTYDNAQKSSAFSRSERTNGIVEDARAAFGELLDTDPANVGFGANATSISFDFARMLAHVIRETDRIVITATDHYANVMPWRWLSRFGAQIDIVDVDRHGDLLPDSLDRALESEPLVVALPYASNATGTTFDIPALAARAAETGAIVVVDCVQAAPHFPLQLGNNVDFAFLSAYKLFAPHFGVWYARPEVRQRFFTAEDPLLPSDPINWSMETGTQPFEALAGWLGTASYLREVGNGSLRGGLNAIADYELELSRHALQGFAERRDRITLYGGPLDRDRLPVFAFNVHGERPERVAAALDAAKIEGRVGDYYVPRLMRDVARDYNGSAVRLSFAHYNTFDEVDRCLAVLDDVCSAARSV